MTRYIGSPKDPLPPVSELLVQLIDTYSFVFYPSLLIFFLGGAAFAHELLCLRRERLERAHG